MADSDTKLEVRNANRSLKKAYRQELKREMNEELDNFLNKKEGDNNHG